MTSSNAMLEKLAEAVTESTDLDQLVQLFLEMLEEVTGLESTYLTRIDRANGLQHILFSHNTKAKQFEIPEGLTVNWDDTLCKRALEERRSFSDDVPDRWGDSRAAMDLGIVTYLSEPVRTGDGELFGTLCGASGSRVSVSGQAQRLFTMLGKLIAYQLERERLLERLKGENLTYSQQALSDPLTGIPNRRALIQELTRALAGTRRTGKALHLAFIDLDGFKAINDQHGHDAGDRFLIQIARSIAEGVRDSDFVARYGGDEFVVFGPTGAPDLREGRKAFRRRLEEVTTGTFCLDGKTIFYPGPSVGIVTSLKGEREPEAILTRADRAMYRIKQWRRTGL